ncbi:MAG: chemotaxis protein CheW [Nitratireductor sp.]|nr:chemotaxis protein CheW [Nitratireductor sp.]MCC0019950.1 chemotaxis protein CheW [Nitratireductor sp.]
MNEHGQLQEFIVFKSGDQEFCIDIRCTKEIRGWTQSTPLPHSSEYVVGVINLRGTILPIVDLAKRMGLKSEGPSERHVIIVVQVGEKSFGMLVDSVSDILNVGPSELRPVPDINADLAEDMFRQVVVLDGRIICEITLDWILPEIEAEVA